MWIKEATEYAKGDLDLVEDLVEAGVLVNCPLRLVWSTQALIIFFLSIKSEEALNSVHYISILEPYLVIRINFVGILLIYCVKLNGLRKLLLFLVTILESLIKPIIVLMELSILEPFVEVPSTIIVIPQAFVVLLSKVHQVRLVLQHHLTLEQFLIRAVHLAVLQNFPVFKHELQPEQLQQALRFLLLL